MFFPAQYWLRGQCAGLECASIRCAVQIVRVTPPTAAFMIKSTLSSHTAQGSFRPPGSPQDTCDPGTFVITASAAACIVSVDSSSVVFCGAGLRREHRTAENDITDTADTLAWCSTDTAILLLILGEKLITADNDIFTDYVLGLLTRCHWRKELCS